ncbi:MAG TPA: hypothetical protein VGD56_18485 [Gemmatirosa sp.]
MRPAPALVVAVAVALAATAAGVALAVRSGGYGAIATATGRVTIPAGSPLAPPGSYVVRYCGSYGNVATQQGYAYTVALPAGRTLTLADSLARTPGPQNPARVTLALDGPDGRYTWPAPRGGASTGTVTLAGPDLLVADVDARLVGPRGDTLPVRAHFACRPRVAPKQRR